jgi:hypothetical protein
MAVEVEVADLPNSQKQLKISVSADECENAYKAVLTRLQKGVHPTACLSALHAALLSRFPPEFRP